MAEVRLARQVGPMHFEKVVVVKMIHPHLASHQQFVDMLLDEEADSLAKLQEFIGKPIQLQVESLYHQEQFDIVLT
jgi:Ribonuclease G/E